MTSAQRVDCSEKRLLPRTKLLKCVDQAKLLAMEKEVKKAGKELNFLRKSQAQHTRGKHSQKFSKAPNKPIASNAVQCKYCGRRQRHSKKEDCPTFGQQCNKCHRYNHFQKMYLSESVDFAEGG